MREDNPATEIANSFSECINACAMLCLKPSQVERDALLDAVSWFVEAAPLNELPNVWAPDDTRDMIRKGAAVAAPVRDAILAWDGSTEPPPSLLRLARELLVSIGMERVLEHQAE